MNHPYLANKIGRQNEEAIIGSQGPTTATRRLNMMQKVDSYPTSGKAYT